MKEKFNSFGMGVLKIYFRSTECMQKWFFWIW